MAASLWQPYCHRERADATVMRAAHAERNRLEATGKYVEAMVPAMIEIDAFGDAAGSEIDERRYRQTTFSSSFSRLPVLDA